MANSLGDIVIGGFPSFVLLSFLNEMIRNPHAFSRKKKKKTHALIVLLVVIFLTCLLAFDFRTLF